MRSVLLPLIVLSVISVAGCGIGGPAQKRSAGKPCARADSQNCEGTTSTPAEAESGESHDVRWSVPWVPAESYDVRWSIPWVPAESYDVRWSVPWAENAQMPRPAGGDAARSDAGTVVPAAEAGTYPCWVGPGTPLHEGEAPADTKMINAVAALCASGVAGPMVVTDLHVSGACTADLFVLGGPSIAPRWLLQSPARIPLHVTGARLVVHEGEFLTIAIAGPKAARADIRCAVTWGGLRP